MSEYVSKCHKMSVTTKEVAVSIRGSYVIRNLYYCDKCGMVCEVVEKEGK